jgi:hypothetical protein
MIPGSDIWLEVARSRSSLPATGRAGQHTTLFTFYFLPFSLFTRLWQKLRVVPNVKLSHYHCPVPDPLFDHFKTFFLKVGMYCKIILILKFCFVFC